MSLDPGSVRGQVTVNHDNLSEYFSLLRKFVSDSTGTQFAPDFADYVDNLDYSELYRMANTRYSDSASFENGAAIENINLVASIIREYTLRGKGKVDYYSDADSDYLQESNYYSTMSIFWVNMISGKYIEGRTS